MRSIIHLDADAFFASVEQAADPRLRGQPVAVGGEKRGIIASASYEARRFGIYTPMPTVRARKLCPKLILLPGDFEKYERFSRWMFSYAYDFTPDVEIGSIDEGYFDLTGGRQPPMQVAENIRQAIRQALKITVSEGIGSNKLVSQIASKLYKPAAFFQVPTGQEISFLHPLPPRWLPGVGPKTAERLATAGLTFIHQIALTPTDLLSLLVGGFAPQLKNFANGVDERPVVPASEPAKSYSQQETFAADQTDEEFIEATLRRMADHLMAKVREDGKSIRTLTVKARYNDMDERQCSESLDEPTDLETDLYSRLRPLLRRAWERRVSLRMVSLKLSNLYDGFFCAELPLEASARQHEARRRLAATIDELRKARGQGVILRGHDFVLNAAAGRRQEEPSKKDQQISENRGRLFFASTTTLSPISANPKGIVSSSPGLRGTSYPGSGTGEIPNPNGVVPNTRRLRHNPVGVETPSNAVSQGSSCLASSLFPSRSATAFVPLAVRSYYSFLNSTLSVKAIVEFAQRYELPAVALCDQGNLHGAVEFVQQARAAGLKPILGAELRLEGKPLRLYVQNAQGYANLCRLLSATKAKARSERPKVQCPMHKEAPSLNYQGTPSDATTAPLGFGHWALDIGHCEGLIAVSPHIEFAPCFPGRFYFEISSPDALRRISHACRFPGVAVLPSHYPTPADRWKYDIVQSIRTLTLLRQEHPEKNFAGDFHFHAPREMQELFRDYPDLLAHSREIAERCNFELSFGPPQFPAFVPPDGSTPREFLRTLVMRGLEKRYDQSGFTDHGLRFTPYVSRREAEGRTRRPASHASLSQIRAQVETELSIIGEVGYEEYFLVVWDVLQECRRRGIEWITRGSAADSLVCYCLEISDVCPIRFDLYFRRFLNKERMALNKLPDIDVDFPHDRKDDVIDMFFEKYGYERCAVVGGFSTFQARSAFTEVAKVLGVAERDVRRFTEHFPWNFGGEWEIENHKLESGAARNLPFSIPHAQEPPPLPLRGGEGWGEGASGRFRGAMRAKSSKSSLPQPSVHLLEVLRVSPDCRDLPLDEEPYRSALVMAEFLDGFPRYPKMHPCGLVLSRQPMHELTPTFVSSKGYPTTHFDMDAVEAIGLVKMDILAQGGLAVMRDVKAMLAESGTHIDLVCFTVNGEPLSNPKSEIRNPSSENHRGVPVAENPFGFRASDSFRISDFGFRTLYDRWRFDDPAVWDMIARGAARAVHHIESPAMISLCRMCNVHDIDTLIAIVSVIRPGAANEDRKREFTRRYQGLSPVTYPHPSLEACLQSSLGLLVYEEQVLQICESFAGLPAGRADVLRRALGKGKQAVIAEIAREFAACARERGRTEEEIARVWEMISGFLGYTFCKAHSTAYGIEAYQSAWLKRYFPAEFMAAVVSNGKGFYRPLVYVLECHRLGIPLRPPWVNEPGPHFTIVITNKDKAVKKMSDAQCPMSKEAPSLNDQWPPSDATTLPLGFGHSSFIGHSPCAIRVPVTYVKGLTESTKERMLAERTRGQFTSLADFYRRVGPSPEEMESLIRVGAFDGFGRSRTAQYWDFRFLCHGSDNAGQPGQGWLFPPAGAERLPVVPLQEPTRRQRLEWEYELLGFPASGHPLELHDHIAWDTYCPVNRLGEFVGEEVVTCGLVIEDRVHHQVTGEPMKFLTLADWTGMIETELFAQTYKSYGLATVRYPVLEVTARVEPFENGRGFTLRVLRAGQPRERKA